MKGCLWSVLMSNWMICRLFCGGLFGLMVGFVLMFV